MKILKKIINYIVKQYNEYKLHHHICENHFKQTDTYTTKNVGMCGEIFTTHQVTVGKCEICGAKITID